MAINIKHLKLSLCFLLLFFLLCLVGCHKSNLESGIINNKPSLGKRNAVVTHLKTPITTIDPAYVQNESEILVSKLIFQGLVKEDVEGEIAPCLAESWEASSDGLVYTFHLKKGAFFHNEKEVKAGDFKFAWERVLRLNAPAAYLFANIVGADDILAGRETVAGGIFVLDDYTLQVNLKKPQRNFINLLTHPAGGVLDRYEVVEQGVDFAKPGTLFSTSLIPSGAGPYMLMEWIDERSMALGKNPEYFADKPLIDRLEFVMSEDNEDTLLDFLAGRIHILQDIEDVNLAGLINEPLEIPLLEKPIRKIRYVALNAQIKPFDNKLIREAIMYALNDAEILEETRKGKGAVLEGYVTDYWYKKDGQETFAYSYNREKAVNLLAEAGYSGGANLPEIPLHYGEIEEDKTTAEIITVQLAKVGIPVKIYPLEQKELRRMIKSGEVGFYTGVFSAKSTELEDFFREQIDGRWQGTINNPAWNALIENVGDQEKETRLNTYKQLEKEVIGDARIKYLYTYKSAVVVSEGLDNFQLGWGNGIDYEGMSLKDKNY